MRYTSGNIQTILEEFIAATGSKSCYLLATDGSLIAQAGDPFMVDYDDLAEHIDELITVSSHLAEMFGESQTSALIQEGSRQNLNISIIPQKALLLVVYGEFGKTGYVRIESQKVVEVLLGLIEFKPAQIEEPETEPELEPEATLQPEVVTEVETEPEPEQPMKTEIQPELEPENDLIDISEFRSFTKDYLEKMFE